MPTNVPPTPRCRLHQCAPTPMRARATMHERRARTHAFAAAHHAHYTRHAHTTHATHGARARAHETACTGEPMGMVGGRRNRLDRAAQKADELSACTPALILLAVSSTKQRTDEAHMAQGTARRPSAEHLRTSKSPINTELDLHPKSLRRVHTRGRGEVPTADWEDGISGGPV